MKKNEIGKEMGMLKGKIFIEKVIFWARTLG